MSPPETASSEIVLAPLDAEPASAVALRQDAPRDVLKRAWVNAQTSPHTRAAYRRDIEQFFRWCDFWSIDVFRVRRPDVDGYRNHLYTPDFADGRRSTAEPAATTVNRKLTSVSSFYEFCKTEVPDAVFANPVDNVNRPHVSDESMTAGLTTAEVIRLLAVAADAGPMEFAIVHLLASTGLRVSEVCDADTYDLGSDRDFATLIVTRKGGKKQKLPLAPETKTALDAYLRGRSGPLFLYEGARITRQRVGRLLAKLGRGANLAEGKTLHPHVFRHTAATLALDNGATLRDVQDMLGHRDPRTTNRYDRARGNLDRSPVHVLARAFRGEVTS